MFLRNTVWAGMAALFGEVSGLGGQAWWTDPNLRTATSDRQGPLLGLCYEGFWGLVQAQSTQAQWLISNGMEGEIAAPVLHWYWPLDARIGRRLRDVQKNFRNWRPQGSNHHFLCEGQLLMTEACVAWWAGRGIWDWVSGPVLLLGLDIPLYIGWLRVRERLSAY